MLEKIYEILGVNPIDKEALMDLVPELRKLNEFGFYHPAHIYGVLDHSIKAAELVDDIFLKLVLIFHDIGKPNTAILVPNYDKSKPLVTKFPNHEKESARIAKELFENELDEERLNIFLKLIEFHDTPLVKIYNENVIEYLTNHYGNEFVGMLLKVQKADLVTHSEKYYKKLKAGFENSVNVYELKYKR